MDLEDRIERRQHAKDASPEYGAISPLTHLSEPVARGAVIERLLDVLAPVFDSRRPGDSYVWGPKGAGKSAVVRALFAELSRQHGDSSARMYTSTRAEPTTEVRYLYIDSRQAQSSFALLHTVVAALSSTAVPKQGVSSSAMIDRLKTQLTARDRQIVLAIDHVGEPETLTPEAVLATFEQFQPSVSCLLIGRDKPAETTIDDRSAVQRVRIEPYTQQALIELLTSRVVDGRLREAITAEQLAELAMWADGDAHDALAALFGAAVTATDDGTPDIGSAALTTGMKSVPRPCVSISRVMSLPTSRTQILERLLAVTDSEPESVKTAAAAISEDGLGLSRATIERILYELAEAGVIRRVKADSQADTGRPPSRLEPRFPTLVFAHLNQSS